MFTIKKIDGTTAGATVTVTTSPTCGLTGCGVKVGEGAMCVALSTTAARNTRGGIGRLTS